MKVYYCNGKRDICDRDHTKDCDGCEHADWTGGEYREVEEDTEESNEIVDIIKCSLNERGYSVSTETAQFVCGALVEYGVIVRDRGEWIDDEEGHCVTYCSVCGRHRFGNTAKAIYKHDLSPFCPKCGADMRKGENNEKGKAD